MTRSMLGNDPITPSAQISYGNRVTHVRKALKRLGNHQRTDKQTLTSGLNLAGVQLTTENFDNIYLNEI